MNKEEKQQLVLDTINFLKIKEVEPLQIRKILNLAYHKMRDEYGVKTRNKKV